MSNRELDRLPDDVAALLAERRDPSPPPDVAGRIAARVAASVGAGAWLGSAAPASVASTNSGAASAASTNASTGAVSAAQSVARTAPIAMTGPLALGLAFTIGAAAGGGAVYIAVRPTPAHEEISLPPAPSVDVPSPEESALIDAGMADLDEADSGEADLDEQAPRAVGRTDDEEDRDARERRVIERARMALARGRFESALDAVRAHEARFQDGRFREEREAIAIQALVGLDRDADARERATGFRARYPRSLFSGVIARALDR